MFWFQYGGNACSWFSSLSNNLPGSRCQGDQSPFEFGSLNVFTCIGPLPCQTVAREISITPGQKERHGEDEILISISASRGVLDQPPDGSPILL